MWGAGLPQSPSSKGDSAREAELASGPQKYSLLSFTYEFSSCTRIDRHTLPPWTLLGSWQRVHPLFFRGEDKFCMEGKDGEDSAAGREDPWCLGALPPPS